MGHRTVVIINNDELDQVRDEELKRLVLKASTHDGDCWKGPYHVVEQCHADQTSLMVIDSLKAETLSSGMFCPDVDLLRAAADKAGYRLVRK